MLRMEEIERVIVRRLDGELGEAESLELDRAILRDPEVRALWDEYRRLDALAGGALDGALGSEVSPIDWQKVAATPVVQRLRPLRPAWFFVPGAVAAALLALVIPRPTFEPAGNGVADRTPHAATPMQPMVPPSAANGVLHNVGTSKRDADRELLGIVGDDGNIYWIEVDRTRIIRRPAQPPALDQM